MMAKADWAHLIPHQGIMCLLDAVMNFTAETIHARSDSHRLCRQSVRSATASCAPCTSANTAHNDGRDGALMAHEAGMRRPRVFSSRCVRQFCACAHR